MRYLRSGPSRSPLAWTLLAGGVMLGPVSCGSDPVEIEEPDPVVAPMISNGTSTAGAISFWRAAMGTSGPALTLQLFSNGTGRIAYDNDGFQPPEGLQTRILYDFTWTESEGDISISFSGESATFSDFVDVIEDTSFDADFSDGTHVETFTFLYFEGADPPR